MNKEQSVALTFLTGLFLWAVLLASCVLLPACSPREEPIAYRSHLSADEANTHAYLWAQSAGGQHASVLATESMLPVLGSNTHLVHVRAWEAVTAGCIIIFNDGNRDIIHSVFRVRDGYVYTRALNSGGRGWDRIAVTEDHYVGTVIGWAISDGGGH